jgi:hypothetical protein
VFVHIAKAGYVAVAETLRDTRRFDEAEVLVDGAWVRPTDQEVPARVRHVDDVPDLNDDNDDNVVPGR